MQEIRRFLLEKSLPRVSVSAAALLLLSKRLWMPKPDMEVHGSGIWLEIAWLLFLYLFILFTCIGLGRLILRSLGASDLTRIELFILAVLLGLGVFSLGIMAIGFIGWLAPWTILLWMGLLGGLSIWAMEAVHPTLPAIRTGRGKDPFVIFLQLVIASAILLILIECLTPVWDYDALLYHLEGPRQFLAQGRIEFDPEVLRSAYPYLGEMPFLAGLAFGLPSLAKLINFTYAGLFVLSGYTFSRRIFGRRTAYTTLGILAGGPAYWMWATWAGVDFAWSTFEFWSLYAVVLWLRNAKKDTAVWLRLAGLMSGLAIGVKYLSIPTLLIMAAIIAWKSIENTSQPMKQAVWNLTIFSGFAALTGGAWYIRNWIFTGNPIYPLLLGGPGWDSLEAQVLSDYVGSFGVGKSAIDFLLLPYNVYAHHNQFSTIGIEWIHPALWFCFFIPFLKKFRPRSSVLLAYTVLGFIIWAISSQVIRFLLPLSAIMASLSAAVIESFHPYIKLVLKYGLIGGFLLFNLVFQFQWVHDRDTLNYIVGRHSASEFLELMSYGHETIRYIRESLGPNQTVRFLWDGRGYYCNQRCVADDEQSGAILIADGTPPPSDLSADLRQKGITHLLLSKPDAAWFMIYHDPRGMHREAFRYLQKVFLPACGRLVHEEAGMLLYEIVCR